MIITVTEESGPGTAVTVYEGGPGPQGATGPQGETGATGPEGPAGADGQGVPVGGTAGQVLAKATATDYDTEWVDAAAGGGAVDSVNGQTGVVVLDATDVGADATGTAAAVVSAHEAAANPHPTYLTQTEGDALYHPLSTDVATQAELDAHTGDTSAAHAASAVSFTPAGSVAATDVQAAIAELDTEKSATSHNHTGTYEPAGTVATHEADTTSVHGIADTSLLISSTRAIQAQTGTSYTLVLGDAPKFVTMTNAAASTLTVPPNSSVAFPVGTLIEGAQLGAGQVTLTPGSGVTINGTPGLKVAAQYGTFGLIKTATDTWLAFGRLSA